MRVILISGQAQHGKDTFGKMLEVELRTLGFSTQIIHFADALKFVCKEYFGWDGNKDERGRFLLQHVGTEIVRAKDEHFWTDFVARLIKIFNRDFIIIPDWRFIEEYNKISEQFDVTTVRIERYLTYNEEEQVPYVNEAMTPTQLAHRSEVELNNWTCDYVVINTTLGELSLSAGLLAGRRN